MNVFENVAFGLRIKKVSQEEIKKRVNDALHLVNLDGFGQRRAESLSGGQMPVSYTHLNFSLYQSDMVFAI